MFRLNKLKIEAAGGSPTPKSQGSSPTSQGQSRGTVAKPKVENKKEDAAKVSKSVEQAFSNITMATVGIDGNPRYITPNDYELLKFHNDLFGYRFKEGIKCLGFKHGKHMVWQYDHNKNQGRHPTLILYKPDSHLYVDFAPNHNMFKYDPETEEWKDSTDETYTGSGLLSDMDHPKYLNIFTSDTLSGTVLKKNDTTKYKIYGHSNHIFLYVLNQDAVCHEFHFKDKTVVWKYDKNEPTKYPKSISVDMSTALAYFEFADKVEEFKLSQEKLVEYPISSGEITYYTEKELQERGLSIGAAQSAHTGPRLVKLDLSNKSTTIGYLYTENRDLNTETYEAKEGYKFSKVVRGANLLWEAKDKKYYTKVKLSTDDQGDVKITLTADGQDTITIDDKAPAAKEAGDSKRSTPEDSTEAAVTPAGTEAASVAESSDGTPVSVPSTPATPKPAGTPSGTAAKEADGTPSTPAAKEAKPILPVVLDLEKTESTAHSDYVKNEKEGLRIYTAKPGYLFNKVVKITGLSDCTKSVKEIWEADNVKQYLTKVILRGSGKNAKYMLLLPSLGDFLLYYKFKKGVEWKDITSMRLSFSDFKFFGTDKNSTEVKQFDYKHYERETLNFMFGYRFKEGIKCTQIIYKGNSVWTHDSSKPYPLGLYLNLYTKNLNVMLPDDNWQWIKSIPGIPKFDKKVAELDILKTDSTDHFEYSHYEREDLRIYTAKPGYVFNRVFSEKRLWYSCWIATSTKEVRETQNESQYATKIILKGSGDPPLYMLVLPMFGDYILYYIDKKGEWRDITALRQSFLDFRFFGTGKIKIKESGGSQGSSQDTTPSTVPEATASTPSGTPATPGTTPATPSTIPATKEEDKKADSKPSVVPESKDSTVPASKPSTPTTDGTDTSPSTPKSEDTTPSTPAAKPTAVTPAAKEAASVAESSDGTPVSVPSTPATPKPAGTPSGTAAKEADGTRSTRSAVPESKEEDDTSPSTPSGTAASSPAGTEAASVAESSDGTPVSVPSTPASAPAAKEADAAGTEADDRERELYHKHYERTTYNFMFGYKFKEGIKCTQIKYKGETVWQHDSSKHKQVYPLGLFYEMSNKNLYVLFPDNKRELVILPTTPTAKSTAVVSVTTPTSVDVSTRTSVVLYLNKSEDTEHMEFKKDEKEDLRIYIAKQGYVFNRAIIKRTVGSDENVWQTDYKNEYAWRAILKGSKDYPIYILLLPVIGNFLLYYKQSKDTPWKDITSMRLSFSDFRFLGTDQNSTEVKQFDYTNYDRSTFKFMFGYAFKDGVKCTKIMYKETELWTYTNSSKDANNPSPYPLGLYYELVDKKLYLHIPKNQLELVSIPTAMTNVKGTHVASVVQILAETPAIDPLVMTLSFVTIYTYGSTVPNDRTKYDLNVSLDIATFEFNDDAMCTEVVYYGETVWKHDYSKHHEVYPKFVTVYLRNATIMISFKDGFLYSYKHFNNKWLTLFSDVPHPIQLSLKNQSSCEEYDYDKMVKVGTFTAKDNVVFKEVIRKKDSHVLHKSNDFSKYVYKVVIDGLGDKGKKIRLHQLNGRVLTVHKPYIWFGRSKGYCAYNIPDISVVTRDSSMPNDTARYDIFKSGDNSNYVFKPEDMCTKLLVDDDIVWSHGPSKPYPKSVSYDRRSQMFALKYEDEDIIFRREGNGWQKEVVRTTTLAPLMEFVTLASVESKLPPIQVELEISKTESTAHSDYVKNEKEGLRIYTAKPGYVFNKIFKKKKRWWLLWLSSSTKEVWKPQAPSEYAYNVVLKGSGNKPKYMLLLPVLGNFILYNKQSNDTPWKDITSLRLSFSDFRFFGPNKTGTGIRELVHRHYERTTYNFMFGYRFNYSVRCSEIKYKGISVWTHDPSKPYPFGLYYDLIYKYLHVQFPGPKWERQAISIPNEDKVAAPSATAGTPASRVGPTPGGQGQPGLPSAPTPAAPAPSHINEFTSLFTVSKETRSKMDEEDQEDFVSGQKLSVYEIRIVTEGSAHANDHDKYDREIAGDAVTYKFKDGARCTHVGYEYQLVWQHDTAKHQQVYPELVKVFVRTKVIFVSFKDGFLYSYKLFNNRWHTLLIGKPEPIQLDIKSKSDTAQYNYYYDKNTKFGAYVAKTNIVFQEVIRSKPSCQCGSDTVLHEAKEPNQYVYKIIIEGMGTKNKKVWLYLLNGNILHLCKKTGTCGKVKGWDSCKPDVKIVTYGSYGPNDDTKFDLTEKDDVTNYVFKDGGRCTDILFDDKVVWAHEDNNTYPRSIIYGKDKKSFLLTFDDYNVIYKKHRGRWSKGLVELDIKKTESTETFLYSKYEKEDLHVYTVKPGYLFNKVVINGCCFDRCCNSDCCDSECCKSDSSGSTSSGSGTVVDDDEVVKSGCCFSRSIPDSWKPDCYKQHSMWHSHSQDNFVYKVILKGSGDNLKYMLLLNIEGNFTLYYKDNENARWIDNTPYRLSFDNFSLFSLDKSGIRVREINYREYLRSAYKFMFGYRFKEGIRCTKIMYKRETLWTYSGDIKDPYPLGLYYELSNKNLYLLLPGPKWEKPNVQIDIDIDEPKSGFYYTAYDSAKKTRTFTAGEQYVFKLVRQGDSVIWNNLDLDDKVEKVFYEGVVQDKKKLTIYVKSKKNHVFEKSSKEEPWRRVSVTSTTPEATEEADTTPSTPSGKEEEDTTPSPSSGTPATKEEEADKKGEVDSTEADSTPSGTPATKEADTTPSSVPSGKEEEDTTPSPSSGTPATKEEEADKKGEVDSSEAEVDSKLMTELKNKLDESLDKIKIIVLGDDGKPKTINSDQYLLLNYFNVFVVFLFKDNVKCLGLKYDTKIVWKRERFKNGDLYPKSIVFKPDGYFYIDFDPFYYAYKFDSANSLWVYSDDASYTGSGLVDPLKHPNYLKLFTSDSVNDTNPKENITSNYKLFCYSNRMLLYVFNDGIVCHEFRFKNHTVWKLDKNEPTKYPKSISVDMSTAKAYFEFADKVEIFKLTQDKLVEYPIKSDLTFFTKEEIKGYRIRTEGVSKEQGSGDNNQDTKMEGTDGDSTDTSSEPVSQPSVAPDDNNETVDATTDSAGS